MSNRLQQEVIEALMARGRTPNEATIIVRKLQKNKPNKVIYEDRIIYRQVGSNDDWLGQKFDAEERRNAAITAKKYTELQFEFAALADVISKYQKGILDKIENKAIRAVLKSYAVQQRILRGGGVL